MNDGKNLRADREVTYTLSELKRTYMDVVHGRTKVDPNGVVGNYCATWASEFANERSDRSGRNWSGGSGWDMAGWIKNGYRNDAFGAIKDYSKTAKRKKVVWGDEGDELDLSKMFSGDPTPFSQRESREAKPGIRIVMELAMSCGTKANTIEQYGAWVAGLTGNLSEAGFDVEADIQIRCRGILAGQGGSQHRGPKTAVNVRLKKYGEQTDFAAWSPMFSPGGFRHLGFLGLGMVADAAGTNTPVGLGFPEYRTRWGVDWDESTRTLTVRCPANPSNFPADKMTAELQAHGIV